MTRVTLELPDTLAKQAERNGVLAPDQVERTFREEVRRRARQPLLEIARIPTDQLPMSMEEIQKEVDAVRAMRRQQRDANRS